MDPEWTILTDFLEGINISAGKMKEAGNALKRTMNNVDIKIYPDSGNKNFGFSTRCIMD